MPRMPDIFEHSGHGSSPVPHPHIPVTAARQFHLAMILDDFHQSMFLFPRTTPALLYASLPPTMSTSQAMASTIPSICFQNP